MRLQSRLLASVGVLVVTTMACGSWWLVRHTEAVAAITGVYQVIAKASRSSQQIAGTVGEQRTATQEISRNLAENTSAVGVVMQNVAQGAQATREISEGIARVDGQAQATATIAEETRTAGRTLGTLASELTTLVHQFKTSRN